MINFESTSCIAHAAVDGDFDNAFYMQVDGASKGDSPVYGNTAETMGLSTFEMNVKLDANPN